jgi:hypothetical protein
MNRYWQTVVLGILFIAIVLLGFCLESHAQNVDLYGSGPTQGYSYLDEKGNTHSGWINHWSVPLPPADAPVRGIEAPQLPPPGGDPPASLSGIPRGSKSPLSKKSCEFYWRVLQDPKDRAYDPAFLHAWLKHNPRAFEKCQPLAAEHLPPLPEKNTFMTDNLMAPEYRTK